MKNTQHTQLVGKIEENGKGYNVNVPLPKINDTARYGDAAYIDVWKCVLLPIARQFNPEMIVISAGFDACIEDQINQDVMAISPPCYGVLCRMLMNVCPKVAVILEGGYNLKTMPPAICYVTWALLRGPIDDLFEYSSPETYNEKELEMYVESTLWYKSIFFQYEFKRFVIDTLKERNQEALDSIYYEVDEQYDREQKEDKTKLERRSVIKKVLMQHRRYWSNLKPLWKYFKTKY